MASDPFVALSAAFGSAGGSSTQSKWNITQSKFRGVPFHIFSQGGTLPDGSQIAYSAGVEHVTDNAGRRKVFYEFPYQDGQTSGDLGRQPFNFDFDVIFFGPNYYQGYQAFYNALNQPTPGVLTHPVLGDINCVPAQWQTTHQSSQRLALTMRVSFHEHTYDPGLPFTNASTAATPLTIGKPSTFTSAVIAVLSAFQTIDAVQTAVNANLSYVSSFKNGIAQLVTTYKSSFLLTLSNIYLTFSTSPVSLGSDLPGVLPVNLGGVLDSSGNQVSSNFPLTSSTDTPFSEVSTPSLANPQTLTPIQATAQVNSVLTQLETLVTSLNSANKGQGALDFYDNVLALKQGGVQLRQALLQGIATSNKVTTQYTVPPYLTMSIREVAFDIGLDVNLCDQITQLNPQILSTNYIAGGTVLNIPVVS